MSEIPFARMMRRKRFEPRTEAMDEYSEHTAAMPMEEDHAPSLKRKLLAALAGGLTGLKDPSAGMELSQGIVREPYRRALNQHQTMGKTLSDRVKQEQDFNELMRHNENDQLDFEAQSEGIEQRRQAAREQNEAIQERNRIAADKAVADAENDANETSRRSAADRLMAAYRNRMAATAEQRAGAYSSFVDK